jgi:hypothetical protein
LQHHTIPKQKQQQQQKQEQQQEQQNTQRGALKMTKEEEMSSAT